MAKKTYFNIGILILVLGVILLINIPYLNLFLAFLVISIVTFSNLSLDDENIFSNKTTHIKLLTVSIIYAILIVAITHSILKPLIEWITNTPIEYGIFDSVKGNIRLLTYNLIVGWFIGGLLEETIFRGYLIRTIKNFYPHKTGIVISVVFSSFLFGFLHSYQGISGQILAGIIGILLAVIYLTNNKNLWLNIYIHGLVNTFSLLLLYFQIV